MGLPDSNHDPGALLGVEWVHAFEQDSAHGMVFRPGDADVPLSRRPRERLVLEAGGAARWLTPGAADGLESRPARWSEQDGQIVLRDGEGALLLRIVDQAPGRLMIRFP